MRERLLLFAALILAVVVVLPAGASDPLKPHPPTAGGAGVPAVAPPATIYAAEARVLAPAATLEAADIAAQPELRRMKVWNEAGMEPVMTGFVRSLPSAIELRRGGFRAAVASNVSTGLIVKDSGATTTVATSVAVAFAKRLRLHLTNIAFPPDTRFAVWSDTNPAIGFGLELAAPGGLELWTPAVSGGRIYLQASVPTNLSSFNGGATIDGVAELFDVPSDLSESCLIDATCVSTTTFDTIRETQAAVGYMNYMDGGQSYACSGTLISTDTQAAQPPYFLTANHCISNQAAASSLIIYFDGYSPSCGAAGPSLSTLPATYGATVLAAGSSSDYSLLKLNSLPSGRWLLGWDPLSLFISFRHSLINKPFIGTTEILESFQFPPGPLRN